MQIDHKHTSKFHLKHPLMLSVTNMVTLQTFDIMADKFNVVFASLTILTEAWGGT
jgi:hypothetical protein